MKKQSNQGEYVEKWWYAYVGFVLCIIAATIIGFVVAGLITLIVFLDNKYTGGIVVMYIVMPLFLIALIYYIIKLEYRRIKNLNRKNAK